MLARPRRSSRKPHELHRSRGGSAQQDLRMTATRAHQTEQAWLAAIIESSEDAIIAKDLNGIVTGWNGAAERLFGYAVDEMLGRPLTIIFPANRADEEAMILGRIA